MRYDLRFTERNGVKPLTSADLELRVDYNRLNVLEARMPYDYGLDGVDKNGNRIAATFNSALAEIKVPGYGYGTSIALDDILKFNRGNALSVADHMGQNIVLNGSTQYAYHADSSELEINTDDFMLCGWIKADVTTNNFYLFNKRSGDTRYQILASLDREVVINCGDGVNVESVRSSVSVFDNNTWIFIVGVFDKSGNGYVFLSGVFAGVDDISNVGAIVSGANLELGKFSGQYADGGASNARIMRFGYNGLYVTGTGGSNLEIRVGSSSGDILYSENSPYSTSVPGGLIPLMYKSPYSSLSDLGFSGIYDADRTECLSETDFATHANWDVTNDWDDSGGDAEYTYSGSNVSLLTQTNVNLNQALGNSEWYAFTYTVAVTTAPDGDFALTITDDIAESAVDLDFTVGTHTVVFKSASDASTQDFIINATGTTDTQGQFTIDNVTLKRIGEVAHYKLNGDVTDETSNALDLTAVATPTYATNYLVSSKIYEHINPHTFTISCWVRPNWDGDDNLNHTIFKEYLNSFNSIILYKYTNNRLYFYYEGSAIEIFCNYDISSWNAGNWHHIVAVADKNTIDGVDYLHLYVDGSEVANSTTKPGLVQGIEENWDYGSDDGDDQFDGLISMQLFNVAFKDTIANAIAIGLPPNCSSDWLYNSASGNANIVDEFTTATLIWE